MSAASHTAGAGWIGRSFLHPAFDYLLIGGGLSLLVTVALRIQPGWFPVLGSLTMATILLVSNMSHFAASTVRLYTKPGTRQSLPFLTMGLPLVALALLVACLAFPGNLGLFLQKLYLTWSPYHYAAQTFGLSVMYCYRSGCQLGDHDKRLLRWVCLLPFLYSFFCAPRIGLEWIVPAEVLAGIPGMPEARNILRETLFLLSFVAPFGLLVRLRRGGGNMPLIAPLLMIANGIWWFVLIPMQAFVWATVFHGIQYLAITLVFHAREQVAQPGNRHSAAVHALRFYAMSMLLGFCLFCALPQAWLLLGFGMVESLLLVVAAINVHHFVVDAYIWKLGRGESNRQITTS